MALKEASKSLAIGFPGQGPHEPQKMKRLLSEFSEAVEMVSRGEETLGRPLLPLLINERAPDATSRDNQVRLYLGSSALWAAAQKEGVIPNESRSIFFGASAGEITALMAAGAYDFETGLKIIDVRGEEMHKASIINPGEMLIASGLPFEQAEKIAAGFDGVHAVNDNPGLQTVFAGTRAGLAEMAGALKDSDVWSHVRWDWAAIAEAAHSPHMGPAVRGLKKTLKKTRMKRPQHTVLGNRAKPLNSVRSAKRHLAQQLTRGVLLAESARVLHDEYGVQTFVDVGPGKVLFGQMRRQFRKSVDVISVVDELLPEHE